MRALHAHAPLVLGVRLSEAIWLAPSVGVGFQRIESESSSPIDALTADAGLGLEVSLATWFSLHAEGRVLATQARTEGHDATVLVHAEFGPRFRF